MNPSGTTAAVILAAGRSSRMKASKPLLPLGSISVIARIVGSVSRAQVNDIVVVTGHERERVAAALTGLPAREAHNPGYDSGMFSSVRTGVKALESDVEAFFILPVDYPLVEPEVLDRLLHRFRAAGRGVLHPCCCGLHGHPPLLSGTYRETILHADDDDDLRSLLARHREDQLEVELEDPTILMDMDTADDYQRITRFAAFLDAAGGASAGATPTSDDALYLLSLLEAPEPVVRHCRAVAAVGEALAEALKPRVPCLDVALVRSACLLHDLARLQPKHAAAGQRLLANLGLHRLGVIVGAHMVLPAEKLATPRLAEEQLVYLADKLVIDDRISGLEERLACALRGRAEEPAALQGARERMRVAQSILDRVESLLGRPVEEVLSRLTPPST